MPSVNRGSAVEDRPDERLDEIRCRRDSTRIVKVLAVSVVSHGAQARDSTGCVVLEPRLEPDRPFSHHSRCPPGRHGIDPIARRLALSGPPSETGVGSSTTGITGDRPIAVGEQRCRVVTRAPDLQGYGSPVRLTETATQHEIDCAALIWDQATAARDGEDDVFDLEESRVVMLALVRRSARSRLFVAWSNTGAEALGFAATEPSSAGNGELVEVRYLAVRPALWGRGIGADILSSVLQRLPSIGFTGAELFVYTDNARAIHLYEHSGWHAAGLPAPDESGRFVQRYQTRT